MKLIGPLITAVIIVVAYTFSVYPTNGLRCSTPSESAVIFNDSIRYAGKDYESSISSGNNIIRVSFERATTDGRLWPVSVIIDSNYSAFFQVGDNIDSRQFIGKCQNMNIGNTIWYSIFHA